MAEAHLKIVEPTKLPLNRNVVERLKDALQAALDGKLQEVVIVGVWQDGSQYTTASLGDHLRLLGAIEVMKARMLERMIDG